MARAFGKIFASQWDDEDFLTLGADAKYVYDFLVAQSDLGHSGIITLRVAPWARRLSKAIGEVEAALRELHQRRYIVADDDEMLLLVRSLIRRDDVYKQPNVFKSAASQIYACPSKPIRAVLLSELERLDESAMKGDTVQVCADLIAWLRKTCGNPSPNPSGGGSRNPQGDASPDISEYGHAPGIPTGGEGSVNPSGNPLPRAPACAGVPLPLPLPLAPSENPSAADAAAPESDALFDAPIAEVCVGEDEPESNAGTLVAEWIESRPGNRPPGRIIGRVGKELRVLLEEDRIPYETVRDGFMAWDRKGADPSAISSFVNQTQAARARGLLPGQRPSTTTRIVDQGVDLIRKMAQEDGVDLADVLPFARRGELTA
jgi:hypothetical protein